MIIGSLQDQLDHISNQLNILTEQIVLMNQRSFGRKTERADQLPYQMSLFDGSDNAASAPTEEPEVTEITVSSHTRKKKSRRDDNLDGLPARIFEHKLSNEELKAQFPNGYKELPCEVYKRLSVIPQTFLVDEHHVHVYASKDNNGTIIKANRPPDLFRNSIATPSLVASIIANKYESHVPLDRQSRKYKKDGIALESNTLANWMINASDLYLSLVWEELRRILPKSKVIHADETPFEVIDDGRKAGSSSYMWVYRNAECDKERPIVLYDFQPTRKTDHPKEFLKDYSGVLVTDGYQVYHSLERKRDDLIVAGCWVHAKRKFAELVKAAGSEQMDGVIAAEASRKITKLFHLDKKLNGLEKEEREKQRLLVVKPAVDDFFAWAEEAVLKVPAESATAKGLQYCINQEQFLRVFLSNGDVPMDNNRAEQSIRPFTLGRKNWVNVYSLEGASASAVLYSLVETAKANNLRVYEYLELLLSELAAHADDTDRSFLKDLLPWSESVQKRCRSLEKS